MRLTDFWQRMDRRFGAGYSHTVARDTHLSVLGGRTASEALEAGLDPAVVWSALCDLFEVPLRDR